MSYVQDNVTKICDEFTALAAKRTADGWDTYWRNCMRYALPQDVSYDQLLGQGTIASVTGAVGTPAYKRTTDLYDQTSLWAIERLTSGLITLKTPEATQWHSLDVDDPFGYEASRDEEAWFDRLSRYLFKVRGNPKTGFWPAHKAAVRSTTAMGDGFFFIEEQFGSDRAPWRYQFVPLGECYVTVDEVGQLKRFFRHRMMTAEQAASQFGLENLSGKMKAAYNNPAKRQETFGVVHFVIPRDDIERHKGIGVAGAPWAGGWLVVDEKHLIGETGYWEMPYIQHSWNSSGTRAYSEGPLAMALAEIKSLNEMAKNELVSSQQAVRPPLATYGENFGRLNLNAGAVNKGAMTGDGRMLVQPIMTHTRPDFAQAVLEQRRNNVREMLYLNLWQILIERPDMTATEALLRSQEKGELLGPVGISFNSSLSAMVDREIAILARKGAFEGDSPLAAPEELMERDIGPNFTSPLDRMRNMEEVIGAQRTVQGMLEVAAFDPKIMGRLNVGEYADLLRRGNGAPAKLFISDEEVESVENQEQQAAQLEQMLALAQQGGQAAQAMGDGAQSVQGALTPQAPAGPTSAVADAVAA